MCFLANMNYMKCIITSSLFVRGSTLIRGLIQCTPDIVATFIVAIRI